MPLIALFAILVGVPLLEVYLFIEIGAEIGALWTIALCLATAGAGALVIRHQGQGAMARAQAALQRNEMPVEEAFDGVCLFVAGVLLMTPGFFTDTVGFLLLVPPLRRRLQAWLASRAEVHVHRGDGMTVEGEWHAVDETAVEIEDRGRRR